MPRIFRRDIQGMSLENLLALLDAARRDGTYREEDIQKVVDKIRKRMLNGLAMVDDETESDVENEIIKKSGGFEGLA
ncbi:MAG: hypothetical protein E8D43_00775 [Nitrospira sp.]|nr:MAG: hypothetical protein E8D43_00775 [Nitrospira sp.]